MITFKQFNEAYIPKRKYTKEEAKKIGDKYGMDWKKYDVEQVRMGIESELEHNSKDKKINVADSMEDVLKILMAHLNEIPNYYTKLKKMEGED
jgi:hypothetical protein